MASGRVGSGWWLGKRPSISQNSSIDLAAELAEDRRGHDAARAVAGVEDDLSGRASLTLPGHRPVFGDDVVRPRLTLRPGGEVAVLDDPVDVLDRLAVERVVPHIILKPLYRAGCASR